MSANNTTAYKIGAGIGWTEKYFRVGWGSKAFWGIYSISKMYHHNEVYFESENPVFIGISFFLLTLSQIKFFNETYADQNKNKLGKNCMRRILSGFHHSERTTHETNKLHGVFYKTAIALGWFEKFFRVGCGTMDIWGLYNVIKVYADSPRGTSFKQIDPIVGYFNLFFLSLSLIKLANESFNKYLDSTPKNCFSHFFSGLHSPEIGEGQSYPEKTKNHCCYKLGKFLSWPEHFIRVGFGNMDIWALYTVIKLINNNEKLFPYSDQIVGGFALLMTLPSLLKLANESCNTINRSDFFKGLHASEIQPQQQTYASIKDLA
ncbi:MAG: hypothetical protein K0U29_03015 [Gammaproteobacteria bacterium]|nr:hypothetical protein [Gammaproteobacteria bacterium]MCH9743882.1 hypothetical protein [Gammaproteobacteria bacterium]